MGGSGVTVTATFKGAKLPPAPVDAQGVWRVTLPPQPATATPATISFKGSDGATSSLKDVLFGDVILCSGQSNMASALIPPLPPPAPLCGGAVL